LFGVDIEVIAFTDVLATAKAQPPLTIADLVFDETPFLIFALLGVGLFIRRELPDSASRLGLVLPAWWQAAVALAAAGVFFVFAQQMDVLSHTWTPDVARRVDAATTPPPPWGSLNNLSGHPFEPGLEFPQWPQM